MNPLKHLETRHPLFCDCRTVLCKPVGITQTLKCNAYTMTWRGHAIKSNVGVGIILTNDGILLMWRLGTIFNQILSEIRIFSIQGNVFADVVCEMAAILSRSQPRFVIRSKFNGAFALSGNYCRYHKAPTLRKKLEWKLDSNPYLFNWKSCIQKYLEKAFLSRPHTVEWIVIMWHNFQSLGLLLLTWFNFNPSMDK